MYIRFLSVSMAFILLSTHASWAVWTGKGGVANVDDLAQVLQDAFAFAKVNQYTITEAKTGEELTVDSVLSGAVSTGVKVESPSGELISVKLVQNGETSSLRVTSQSAAGAKKQSRMIQLPGASEEMGVMRFQSELRNTASVFSGSSKQAGLLICLMGVGFIVAGVGYAFWAAIRMASTSYMATPRTVVLILCVLAIGGAIASIGGAMYKYGEKK